MTTPMNLQDPRNNPLLREIERVSPALELCLYCGEFETDADGIVWELPQMYAVGAVMVSKAGNLYRIVGFTLDNLVIAQPHGLGHDSSISTVVFKPEGLHYPKAAETLRHKDSLI